MNRGVSERRPTVNVGFSWRGAILLKDEVEAECGWEDSWDGVPTEEDNDRDRDRDNVRDRDRDNDRYRNRATMKTWECRWREKDEQVSAGKRIA